MNNHVIIIAEAGVNHNGDYELAKQLVLNAKEAGVDYVKFQTAKPELVISRFAEMAEYQKTNTGMVESQLEMCKKIHLKLEDYKPLKTFCEEVGVKFISRLSIYCQLMCLRAWIWTFGKFRLEK